jgi:hypothetical protein
MRLRPPWSPTRGVQSVKNNAQQQTTYHLEQRRHPGWAGFQPRHRWVWLRTVVRRGQDRGRDHCRSITERAMHTSLSHAGLARALLTEAERQVSAAPESRSGAEAVRRRLQTIVRQSLGQRLRLSMFFPAFFFHRLW